MAEALGLDPTAVVDLSASLNPFAPDVTALAIEVLARHGDESLTAYPDASSAAAELAGAIGVAPERLVLTNGGAEAIALLAHQLGTGQVVEPEFSLYRRHLSDADHGPRWRSNPSNPSGRLAEPADEAGVWDEAFYPLATGRWTRGDELSWRIGSLTKLWSCPGLRLGFAIAPSSADAAAALRRAQPEWAVNGLALTLLPELLARTDLPGWHEAIGALRDDFTIELRGLGLAVTPTDANWVLVDRPGLRDDLAPRGIVVRDCTSFGLADTFRVALPRLKPGPSSPG